MFDRVWSCLIKFEGHQAFDQKRKTFLLFLCLMGDVLFVWTVAYQTCLTRACVPRLLGDLSIVSSVFDQTCFNRLATYFNISMFGHQTMFDHDGV